MNPPSSPECYGEMFPSLETVVQNRDVAGKVFGYRLNAPGIVSGPSAINTDGEAWERCLGCLTFDSCYRLSLGKLLMRMALKT